ncbi:MAG: ribosome small subunit-dependent GTPase A [Rhodothermales bacterium]|nr:ribosome small subunit-dependent GTPase A [Rhodothermales bacterium]
MTLTDYGFDSATVQVPEGLEAARVTAVNRTNCEVITETGPLLAELTGRLRFVAESGMDFPAVGDWVALNRADDFALITEVLPRASVLRRRRPSSESEFQLLAANVDVALILHGCNLPVNVRRLERFAAMAADGGVQPQVVLSKIDLFSRDEAVQAVAQVAHLGDALTVSALTEGGADDLMRGLEPGRTYVMLGPSGAGKTTLLNRLMGRADDDATETGADFATREVRAGDGKGRHTTTRRHLVRLPSGALLIDTPGVRELGMTDMHQGIDDVFGAISDLADECRFRDCSHQGEAGCAVGSAVERGELDQSLVDAWHKLEREAAHFERSIAERRQLDKATGKLYKSIMQGKKDRR